MLYIYDMFVIYLSSYIYICTQREQQLSMKPSSISWNDVAGFVHWSLDECRMSRMLTSLMVLESWVPTGKNDHHGHERLSQRFQLEESLRQQICPGTQGTQGTQGWRVAWPWGTNQLISTVQAEPHLNGLNGTCTGCTGKPQTFVFEIKFVFQP